MVFSHYYTSICVASIWSPCTIGYRVKQVISATKDNTIKSNALRGARLVLPFVSYLRKQNSLAVILQSDEEVKPGPDAIVVLHGGQDEAEVVDVLNVLLFLALFTSRGKILD